MEIILKLQASAHILMVQLNNADFYAYKEQIPYRKLVLQW